MADTDQTNPSDETEIDDADQRFAEHLLNHETGTRATSEESRAETVENDADELADTARGLVSDALDRFGPDDERRAEIDEEGRAPDSP
ncbi:hypothetical protein [Acidipropionibacterium virtanenii]|uniref:Uncharacterized protein n=1 Tax=Acidipropionibacterium virtanenii TaxID=2057246 RepID=A0A344UR33_9ACTN|nr:hypothetical protein [Acidipropionibacterium virtanenii]AXE37731.1 hypothetical protein JS278_00538 [Acidipropionibacterium virtanenii]